MAATKRSQLAIEQLIPNPRNPRVHPKEQIDGLLALLEEFGQPRPILARAANKMIIAGHGIWEAMKLAGHDKVDVLLWDVDQKTADKFMLADNRWGELSRHDDARVADLLRELDDGDLPALGFSAEERDALLADGEDDELDVAEIETDTVLDEFWVTIRGPLADQAKALKRLQDAMADLPQVEVELGTVAG